MSDSRFPLPDQTNSDASALPMVSTRQVAGPWSRGCAILIGLYALGAFLAQVWVTNERFVAQGLGWWDGVERLSSYLTNLTVFLTALAFLLIACPFKLVLADIFRRPPAITAVVLYMVFVGLGYNLLLRGLWTPLGYRSWLNESVHTALPVLTALYWVCFVPRFHLSLRQCLLWLVYPIGYLVMTFWRGSRSDFYPYPFLNVARLGYERVLLNALMLTLGFLILMALFLAFNHRRRR